MISDAERSFLRVGFKQTVKAIKENKARKVYLAEDCEESFIRTVHEALQGSTAEICYVETMRELGKMCGIEIGASCAVITG